MKPQYTFKLVHFVCAIALILAASVGGAVIGTSMAKVYPMPVAEIGKTIELPPTIVNPVEENPVFIRCNAESMDAAGVMFDRQYRNLTMGEAGIEVLNAIDNGEKDLMDLTIEVFGVPRGTTDGDKEAAIIMFGMKKFAECVSKP